MSNTPASEYLLVLSTCPDSSTASVIATALLEERLAACVTRLPGVTSQYRWKGRVEQDEEILLLIKTTAASYSQVEDTINRLHPYELPEIVGVPLSAGSKDYLDWIRQSIQ